MHHSACQRPGEHWQETCPSLGDITKAFHPPLEQSALRILVAITDSYPPGVFSDLGGHKQKTQTRRSQPCMLKFLRRHSLFLLKQQQPAIQVGSQHHQLKMHAVGGPAPVFWLWDFPATAEEAMQSSPWLERCTRTRRGIIYWLTRRSKRKFRFEFHKRTFGCRSSLVSVRA
jgi:hypothetical protein